MKQRRHTPEHVIGKLAEGEKLLNQGNDIAEVCRQLEITQDTDVSRRVIRQQEQRHD
jgi:putative transposase